MGNVLGLLGIAVFIVCVIGLAMSVTWVVVRFSPKPGSRKARRAAASSDG